MIEQDPVVKENTLHWCPAGRGVHLSRRFVTMLLVHWLHSELFLIGRRSVVFIIRKQYQIFTFGFGSDYSRRMVTSYRSFSATFVDARGKPAERHIYVCRASL